VGIRIQIRVWVRVRGRVRVSNNTFTHPFASSSYLRRGTSDVLVLVLVLSWSCLGLGLEVQHLRIGMYTIFHVVTEKQQRQQQQQERLQPVEAMMKSVVAGQGDQAAPAVGQREEHLNSRVVPNLHVQ